MDKEEYRKPLRVLELYSGIGGMHFAIKATGVLFEVIEAYEINPLVLQTYAHNFPKKPSSPRNIESLTSEEINKLDIDIILMSPPCQPFCRTGRKLGIQDTRSSSLSHLLEILPRIHFKYLLLENVKGFENSDARDQLINTMKKCGMNYQEFLLTPTVIDVPNSRVRYFLIAKKIEMKWCFKLSDELLTSIPFWESEDPPYKSIVNHHDLEWETYRTNLTPNETTEKGEEKESINCKWCVGDILETSINDFTQYLIPETLVDKYGPCMDIVNEKSTTSNCFTKGYGTYVKGTGSYIVTNNNNESTILFKETENNEPENIVTLLKMAKLRYFTPREVARLLCYPDSFSFPQHLTNKQKYKALGNSINVYIVSILISLLVN